MATEFWILLITVGILQKSPGIDGISASENMQKKFHQKELVSPKVFHGDQLLTTTLTPSGHFGRITVVFHAFEEDFIWDLQLNVNLFAARYVEKRIHKSHNRFTHLSVNHTEQHCYYHGKLRASSSSSSSSSLPSSAAISTCDGIRGQFSVGDEVYVMEPASRSQASFTSEHFIFKSTDLLHGNMSCGQNFKPRLKRSGRYSESTLVTPINDPVKILEPGDADGSTRYIEMYVVNDYSQFVVMGRRVEDVIRRTKDVINIVSSIYRPLGIYVIMVGVEVWTERDLIRNTGDSENTMNQFLEYRRRHINPSHRNDNAQLIIGAELGGGIVGKAPIMTICTYKTSGGVNSDRHSNLGSIATTVAHELGHNLGLPHDLDSCDCEDHTCVMSSGGGPGNPTKWSSCSRQILADMFHQGMDYCLKNLPEMTYVGASCGNGFVEDGEECDCGLEQDCKTRCCVASTCRFAINATCASGHCCNLATCQPMERATVCREPRGFCDLPEFCDGESEHCPSDVFKEDGSECFDDRLIGSYCYRGSCRTHEAQCRMLWGRTGKMSHQLCFEEYNVMGSAYGHCGFSWTNESFRKCQPKDVLCGMLHCEHRSEKLMFWKEALMYVMPDSYVYVAGQRHDCKAAIMDVGLDMPDPGVTFDGTKCGENQICLSRQCVSKEVLNAPSCPDCNGHGICNSLGQCHCDLDYAPPFCDGSGLGGSLHSGPAQKYPPSNVGLAVGLCILFLLVIPFFVAVGYLVYRRSDRIKFVLIQQFQHCSTANILCKKPKRLSKNPKEFELSPPQDVVVNGSAGNRNSTAEVVVRAPSIRRAVSFRPEDISGPLLQSSTNSTVNVPSAGKNPASLTHANSCRAAIAVDNSKPTSPASNLNDKSSAAVSNHSISSHASDLSSASNAADMQCLLPKKGNRNETETVTDQTTQPLRPAPLPPSYACPNKNPHQIQSSSNKKTTNNVVKSPDTNAVTPKSFSSDSTTKRCDKSQPVGKKQVEGKALTEVRKLPEKKSLGTENKAVNDSKASNNVSRLKNAFEGNDKRGSDSTQPSSNAPTSEHSSVPFQPVTSNKATKPATRKPQNPPPNPVAAKAVPPKRPPPPRQETFGGGSRAKPNVTHLKHSASDADASSVQVTRPSLVPKPPSKLTTNNS